MLPSSAPWLITVAAPPGATSSSVATSSMFVLLELADTDTVTGPAIVTALPNGADVCVTLVPLADVGPQVIVAWPAAGFVAVSVEPAPR